MSNIGTKTLTLNIYYEKNKEDKKTSCHPSLEAIFWKSDLTDVEININGKRLSHVRLS